MVCGAPVRWSKYTTGLFEENPLMKNCGTPWKEGEIRLEVDKSIFS